MPESPHYTPTQRLLMQLRKDYCKDNSAELARQIGKDATYVHRLFYPIGKKGGKGIGLEIMQACTQKFKLPPGFWEGAPVELEPRPPIQQMLMDRRDPHRVAEPTVQYLLAPSIDRWIKEAIDILTKLTDAQKSECLQYLRGYAAGKGPPQDGQALHMAG